MSQPEAQAGLETGPLGVHVFTDDDRIRQAYLGV